MKQRWLLVVLGLTILLLLAVPLVYLIAANAFLKSDRFDRTVNGKPNKLYIHYGSAWTIYPGTVHLKDFLIRSQDNDIKWQATLKEATVNVNLWALLQRKFETTQVRASGGTFALTLGNPPLPAEPPVANRRPFRVEIRNLRIEDFSSIALQKFTYEGDATVAGGFYLEPGNLIRIFDGEIQSTAGKIRRETLAVSRDFTGRIYANVPEWHHAGVRGITILDHMDSSIDLDAKLAGADFLNYYLNSLPWLKVDEVDGSLKIRAKVSAGNVQPDSTAVVNASRMTARLGEFRALGNGSVKFRTSPQGIHMDLALKDYRGFEKKGEQPFMRGPTLSIKADNHDLGLRKVFSKVSDLEVSLAVPAAQITDMRFINMLLPSQALQVVGGTATLDADLHFATERTSKRGQIKITSTDLQARYRDTDISANVQFDSEITDAKKEALRFHITNTQLFLGEVHMTKSDPRSIFKLWSGRAFMKEAWLEPRSKVRFKGHARLDLQDARPILSVLALDSQVARLLQKITDIQDLHGETDFSLGPNLLELRDAKIRSNQLNVEGDVQLIGKVQNIRGLVEFSGINVGIDMRGKHTETKLVNAREWLKARPKF